MRPNKNKDLPRTFVSMLGLVLLYLPLNLQAYGSKASAIESYFIALTQSNPHMAINILQKEHSYQPVLSKEQRQKLLANQLVRFEKDIYYKFYPKKVQEAGIRLSSPERSPNLESLVPIQEMQIPSARWNPESSFWDNYIELVARDIYFDKTRSHFYFSEHDNTPKVRIEGYLNIRYWEKFLDTISSIGAPIDQGTLRVHFVLQGELKKTSNDSISNEQYTYRIEELHYEDSKVLERRARYTGLKNNIYNEDFAFYFTKLSLQKILVEESVFFHQLLSPQEAQISHP